MIMLKNAEIIELPRDGAAGSGAQHITYAMDALSMKFVKEIVEVLM